jgi:hypothetical protein
MAIRPARRHIARRDFTVLDNSGVNASIVGAAPGSPFITGTTPQGNDSLFAGILSGTNPVGELGQSGGVSPARPPRSLGAVRRSHNPVRERGRLAHARRNK